MEEFRRFIEIPVTLTTYKYPDIPHYEWNGVMVDLTESSAVVVCPPDRMLKHFTKAKEFTIPNWSVEYMSLHKGFSVALEWKDGKVLSYYCNVCLPAMYKDEQIKLVDLDLDYVKREGEGWKVVDEEEFLLNQKKYVYPKEVVSYAEESLEDLKKMVQNKEYPFNGELLKWLDRRVEG